MKPKLFIHTTSCMCGGQWAWYAKRPSGAYESLGCVCHNPIAGVVDWAVVNFHLNKMYENEVLG